MACSYRLVIAGFTSRLLFMSVLLLLDLFNAKLSPERQGSKSQGVRAEEGNYATTRMTPTLRWTAMRAFRVFYASFTVRAKLSHTTIKRSVNHRGKRAAGR